MPKIGHLRAEREGVRYVDARGLQAQPRDFPDAVSDGPVVGAVLGFMDDHGARQARLLEAGGGPFREKAEGPPPDSGRRAPRGARWATSRPMAAMLALPHSSQGRGRSDGGHPLRQAVGALRSERRTGVRVTVQGAGCLMNFTLVDALVPCFVLGMPTPCYETAEVSSAPRPPVVTKNAKPPAGGATLERLSA